MGLAGLQHGAVVHDGGGEVGQVLFPEEGQGQPPQLLGQTDPAHPGLHVGSQKSAVILQPGADHDEQAAGHAGDEIETAPARQAAVQQVPHQAVEQANRQHKGDILQGAEQTSADGGVRPLGGQGEAAL